MTLKIFVIGLLIINYVFISVKIRPNRFSLQNNVKSKSIKKLNTKCQDIEIKQHLQVTYGQNYVGRTYGFKSHK